MSRSAVRDFDELVDILDCCASDFDELVDMLISYCDEFMRKSGFRVLIGEMSSRKEEERNEKTIRSLMKLPENRSPESRGSGGSAPGSRVQGAAAPGRVQGAEPLAGVELAGQLGKSYVKLLHLKKIKFAVAYSKCHHPMIENELPSLEDIREFTHRSAKEIYFKEWDAQRQSFPDSSNVERLRDFIKHVYVDRRYSGERSLDKPPRAKTGEVEGSRSPPYENERRFSDRPSPGGRSDGSSRNSYDERRSPGYDQDFKKSPARTDVVNDWRREDRFGNGRRSDDGGSKVESRSPDRQSNPDMSSPPIVRPVREILGDSVSPLRVLEPPKANGSRPAVGSFQTQEDDLFGKWEGRSDDGVRPVREILGDSVSPLRVLEPPKANGSRPAVGSFQTQRTASSSSLASSNGNPTELRRESSLIDFDADPEPPSTAPVQQTQQIAPSPAPAPAPFAAQPTVPSNDNWASFDSSPVVKASHPPSSGNLLDMLSELSVPASGNVQPAANVQVPPFGTAAPAVTPGPAFTPGGAPFAAFGSSGGGQWQNVHAQQNILPATGIQPPTSSFNQAAGGYLNNQPSSAPSGNSQITSSIEAKPKELPADLFTSSYSPYAAQGPSWYPAPQYGMGYNMQYNVPQGGYWWITLHVVGWLVLRWVMTRSLSEQPMPPGFVQPSKSSNPFDVNDSPAAQATTFPSMAPLQGALPNMAPPSRCKQHQAWVSVSFVDAPTQFLYSFSNASPGAIWISNAFWYCPFIFFIYALVSWEDG
ncbi:hypothetical protein Tco_0893327 [Tanacetum coccineum]|uniref:Arf-GAP domain-containing protein n=1 Tax=Tanacetum coccineum TaxID=301880 RepID=A0ABQ5C906_9ASTR